MMGFSKASIKDDAQKASFEHWVGIVAERNDPGHALEPQSNQDRADDGGLDAIKVLQNVLTFHAGLKQQSMAERDSMWTTWVNITFHEESNPVASIVSWALSLLGRPADKGNEHLQAISIVLAWFLASSDRTLRDRATKALTTVFLAETGTFEFVLERMHDCNDPYIVERLYAAAFGACCNDQSPQRLRVYSQAVFAKVFADGNPPVALLTRDYALGIIELAASKGAKDDHIVPSDCYPPYNSDAPVFGLIEGEVKKFADSLGDDRIFNSVFNEREEFGKRIIPRRVGHFTNSRLDQPEPDKNVKGLSESDLQQCRLWVIKRAYGFGWRVERFLYDLNDTDQMQYKGLPERIGMKYQRIALDELQARLADNFWMLKGYPEQPCKYRYNHGGGSRDIEPTILPSISHHAEPETRPEGWISEPIVSLPEICPTELKQWPFTKDPTKSMREEIYRTDANGKSWLVFYDFSNQNEKHQKLSRTVYGLRREEFRFLYCVFVKRQELGELTKYLTDKQSLDKDSFLPLHVSNGPYLLEAHWRDTWRSDRFYRQIQGDPKGTKIAIPVANYSWEYGCDRTLQQGYRICMPQKWLTDELHVSMLPENPYIWANEAGEPIIRSRRSYKHETTVVIDEQALLDYASRSDLEPLWIMIGERSSWPDGAKGDHYLRRSEGLVWRKDSSFMHEGWNNDIKS